MDPTSKNIHCSFPTARQLPRRGCFKKKFLNPPKKGPRPTFSYALGCIHQSPMQCRPVITSASLPWVRWTSWSLSSHPYLCSLAPSIFLCCLDLHPSGFLFILSFLLSLGHDKGSGFFNLTTRSLLICFYSCLLKPLLAVALVATWADASAWPRPTRKAHFLRNPTLSWWSISFITCLC